ncbi:DCL family protein [Chelatococcus sambhunathii]|nr:DCL family protein [Chelatococcus sambhunathii]
MTKTISFGPLDFARKLDAEAFLKAMLNKYDVGDRVSAQDAEILRDALALHPDAAAKIGCGVDSFSVRSADYGTKCFWINRPDGSTEKFSFRACIYG